MRKFQLSFEDTQIHTTVMFENTELLLLKEYLFFARELEATEVASMGMPFKYKFEWNHETSAAATVSLPPWSLFQVYLHRIRPFILKNERTNFYSICKLISRRVNDLRVRKAIEDEKQLFEGANIYNVVQVYSNDQLLTSEKVLQNFLNGFEYHKDRDRREALEALHVLLPIESSRIFWYWFLQEKGGAILRVAEFVRGVVDASVGEQSPPISIELLS